MMKRYSKHLPHYISLIGILVATVIGFIVFSYDREFQVSLAIAAAVSYVSWGIIHHAIHKDLYPQIVIEYIAFSLLGLVVVLSVIGG